MWFDSLSGSDVVIVLACVSSVDCLDPMCSGHGTCHHGECHCNPGWGGISCDILKSTCPEQCSSHGTFNTDAGVCICEANWTGADCSIGQNGFYLFIYYYYYLFILFSIPLKLGLQLICLFNSKCVIKLKRKTFVLKVNTLFACSFFFSIQILAFFDTDTIIKKMESFQSSININLFRFIIFLIIFSYHSVVLSFSNTWHPSLCTDTTCRQQQMCGLLLTVSRLELKFCFM